MQRDTNLTRIPLKFTILVPNVTYSKKLSFTEKRGAPLHTISRGKLSCITLLSDAVKLSEFCGHRTGNVVAKV